jgi:hypothetical protein
MVYGDWDKYRPRRISKMGVRTSRNLSIIIFFSSQFILDVERGIRTVENAITYVRATIFVTV